MIIDSFSGNYRFLSNFYVHHEIEVDGIRAYTVEHVFQALKARDLSDAIAIARASTPGKAKRMGRQVQMRPDWELVKLDMMRRCLRRKFFSGSDLAQRLIETGNATLIEGNTWGDRFWGCTKAEGALGGENWLGRLLMLRRSELVRKMS